MLNLEIKSFEEIEKLSEMLDNAGIPHEDMNWLGGKQVNYPSKQNVVCDAILNPYSYGHEEGLLEIMGLVNERKIGDSVEGYLTAEEVFKRIKKHYKRNHRKIDKIEL